MEKPADRSRSESYLNEFMEWFTRRYRPKADGDDWAHHHFDRDLHQLVRLVYEEAQRPFIHELNTYRDHYTLSAKLSAAAPIVTVAEKPK